MGMSRIEEAVCDLRPEEIVDIGLIELNIEKCLNYFLASATFL